jgi:hypothetical protein
MNSEPASRSLVHRFLEELLRHRTFVNTWAFLEGSGPRLVDLKYGRTPRLAKSA